MLFSCRSPRGEFCEPPRGGASARTAEAGLYFYKPQPPEHLFSLPTRVAASCIFQSAAEFANNVQVMGISRSLTLRPGPARAESATPAAGPGEHLNEFPNGNDSMQRQHCHSEEIGRSTKNLYKSIRRQILDCTSFVFLLLARKSPSAAFGSQGKRFFTSFRMTKGLDSGAACGARLRACAGQGCGPNGSKEPKNDATTFVQKPLFRTLRRIPLSDCSLRLLRATAPSGREPWGTSARTVGTGLRRLSFPAMSRQGTCGSTPGR